MQEQPDFAPRTDIDTLWTKHTKALLSDMATQFKISGQPAIVNDQPFVNSPSGCYDAIVNALSVVGVSAPDILTWERDLYRIAQWDSLYFDNRFKLIPGDTIRAIFADEHRWWNYFYEQVGTSFWTFSAPIFFNDYQYALVNIRESCGGLCDFSGWYMVVRENGRWRAENEFCISIS